ncbi:CobW domain-containing protein [Saccharata proteae CBS 121410]|uniref:CobW domain-containing protein n=1 Tax=Saccharata proteae CBS 121410 TaxID=1314787 RepID=A0A9P4M138_9PEZI|nr:CobW domain-containing protein [Saccharata proteae CBS 121410]
MSPIPITIITGFLGSGKTTLILNLIPQLPSTYKLALLKNEFGDVAIDSQLASSAAISGVQELLNGCICCNMTGQLGDALAELRNTANPDRIVIETSGSAFPATLAMEVNRISRETGHYLLDGVMSVVDVENWQGYEDTSYSAKVQAQYTDLIVLNKCELVSERRVEDVEDKIRDLELEVPTPIVKSTKGAVDKDIVFGLDARLAGNEAGLEKPEHGHDHKHDHQSEVEVLQVTVTSKSNARGVNVEKLDSLLRNALKDEVYRMKAVLYASKRPQSSSGQIEAKESEAGGLQRYILNWAFGRWTFTSVPASPTEGQEPSLRMTIITARYESTKWMKRIEAGEFCVLEDEREMELEVKRLL